MKTGHRIIGAIGALLMGCGGCGTGTLNIEVQSPAGVAPDILTTGPNGYRQTISRSGALSLSPGTYVVTANPSSVIGSIVEDVYDATPTKSTVTVTTGTEVTVHVAYSHRVGSGEAWLALNQDEGPDLAVFTAADLDGGLLLATDGWLDGGASPPEALAFDATGAAWVTTEDGPVLRVSGVSTDAGTTWTSTAQLLPAVISDSFIDAGVYAGFQSPDGGLAVPLQTIGVAFDSKGNLYVANCDFPAMIIRYTAAQLAAGGAQVPDMALLPVLVDAGYGTSFHCIYSIAFDSQGNLWLADYNDDTVVRYGNPSALHGPVAPQPDALLLRVADAGGGGYDSLGGPNGIAFDSQGSLWVANWDGKSVVRFDSPGGLSGSVAPMPAALLQNQPYDGGGDGVGLFGSAAGVFFDNSGALWVASAEADALSRFTNPLSLTGNVVPVPDRIVGQALLTNLNGGNQGLNPSPSNLPVYH